VEKGKEPGIGPRRGEGGEVTLKHRHNWVLTSLHEVRGTHKERERGKGRGR